MIYFEMQKLELSVLKIFESFRNFQIFIIFGILGGCVCVSHSQQKLPQRLSFTEADLNDTLLVTEDGLKPNEFIDLSHGTRFHPKSAETAFNLILTN